MYRARKFFTPKQLLLLYKSQIRPTLEYCCHVWGGAPPSSLALLDSIQRKCIRFVDDPELTATIPPLSPSEFSMPVLFYRYCHGKCPSELAASVPLPQSFTRATRSYTNSHAYQVTFPSCRTEHFSSSFFLRTARIWNSLPLSVFPSSYNLPLFRSRVNVHLLNPP